MVGPHVIQLNESHVGRPDYREQPNCGCTESVCARPLHTAATWTLNRMVMRSINGFNSRFLHVMTGEHYRETATAPAYDLVLALRRRRLRYLGHVLRMPADRMVRSALMTLVSDCVMYPTGSLFSDCQGVALLWQWCRIEQCGAPKGIAIVNMRVKVISCTILLNHTDTTLRVYNEYE